MSLLEKVLHSAENAAVDNLTHELPSLERQSKQLKRSVLKYLQETYVEYTKPPSPLTVADELARLSDSHNRLSLQVDNLRDDRDKYLERLAAVSTDLVLCKTVHRIADDWTNIRRFVRADEWAAAVKLHKDVRSSFDGIVRTAEIERLCLLVTNDKQKLLSKLDDVVRRSLTCSSKESSAAVTALNYNDDTVRALFALSSYDDSIPALDKIAHFLWRCCVEPMVRRSIATQVDMDEASVTFRIAIGREPADLYKQPFANLIGLTDFLYNYFNYDLSDGGNTMQYIGKKLEAKLVDAVTNVCLKRAVAFHKNDMEKCLEIVKCAETLQKRLVEVQILPNDNKTIVQCVSDINNSIATAKCEDYRAEALELVLESLTVTVSVDRSADTYIDDDGFPFSISKSVVKLLQLVREILSAAIEPSNLYASRLLYKTAKNILISYGFLANKYHLETHEATPEKVALFYNNCLYVHRELGQRKWTDLFGRVPHAVKTEGEMYVVKRTPYAFAGEVFDAHLLVEMRRLEAIVDDLSGSVCTCLHQLRVLKDTYEKLLSPVNYRRTVGAVLNSLCELLVERVIALDDVSEGLEATLRLFEGFGVELLPDGALSEHVRSWGRFREVLLVVSLDVSFVKDKLAKGSFEHLKVEEVKRIANVIFKTIL